MFQPNPQIFQRAKDEAEARALTDAEPGLGYLQALRVIQSRRLVQKMAERRSAPSWCASKTEG